MLGIVRRLAFASGDIGFGNCFLRFIAEQQRIYQRRNYGPEWCCGSRSARGPDVQGHEGILDLVVRCQRLYSFRSVVPWRLYKLSVARKVFGDMCRRESLSASATRFGRTSNCNFKATVQRV